MTEELVLKTLTWLWHKIVQGLFSFLNVFAFPLAVLVSITGCLLVIIGFRKKGFKWIGMSFILYILIQIILLAVEIAQVQ